MSPLLFKRLLSKSKHKKFKKVQKKSFWTKRNTIIVIIGFFVILTGVYFLFIKKGEPKFVKEAEVTFYSKDTKTPIKKIDAEVAAVFEEQQQGLMHRSYMADSLGMIFIYSYEAQQSFWMKNTLIPLDIAFIDSKGVIDTIYRKTKPLSETSLPSRRKIQYVVEVNGGYYDRNGIKEGDMMSYQLTK